MKVDILDMQKLFGQPVRYEIPPFQRRYIWNEEKQWGPLWEDVENTAKHYLKNGLGGTTTSKPPTHFLGAIVLRQLFVRTGDLDTRRVVDGQQRLTTLQLLLGAAQEVFAQRGDEGAAKRIESLVLNDEELHDDNPNNAFKVWPTKADQEAFRYAMRNDLPSNEHEASLIVQAHEYFKLRIRKWLEEEPKESKARTQSLRRVVTDSLELVVIDLDKPEEDHHAIFETLNARGTPLLESDLIKNMVLTEAGEADPAQDYPESKYEKQLWDFDDAWWIQEVGQGRLKRPRIDVFLNYWLIMRNGREVKANEVFSVFRQYYKDKNEPIANIATDIHSVGKAYRVLEEASNPDMATFLYRWGVMRGSALTPVLLWLLSSEVPTQQMKKSLRALESHMVRRMVCGLVGRSQQGLVFGLIGRLNEVGPARAGDAIVAYLQAQRSTNTLWPNDQRLEEAFTTRALYWGLPPGRMRMILEGIEEELRTDKAESKFVPRKLTIEHIMPKKWGEYWQLPLEVDDEVEATQERDRVIDSIGNLTLVNKRLNPALSNAPWEEKRTELNKHTTLFLNKDLIDEAPDVWDESAIAERAKRLSKVAIKIWPYADKI